MPVAAQVGRLGGHHDVVAGPGRNGAVAVRTGVLLGGHVGLDEANLHLAETLGTVHASAQQRPGHQDDGHEQPRAHEDEV